MAARLSRVHSLTVWNRTIARAEEFAASHPATVARTPREAAGAADVVITCLPTSTEVEALLDGPDGLLAGFSPGGLLLDCTSGDPATSRRIAARLAEHQVDFADAPVSGGTNGAEAGTLTVMVGGSEAVLRRGLPALQAFGKRIELMGPIGAGHAMKAVNNALLGVNIAALGEGLSALVKAGIPAAKAVEVLNASSGRSFVSEHLVPERVLTGAYPQTFRLALLHKDAGIALEVLEEQRVDGPVLEVATDVLGVARDALGEEADYLEVIRFIEQEAGVEIRA